MPYTKRLPNQVVRQSLLVCNQFGRVISAGGDACVPGRECVPGRGVVRLLQLYALCGVGLTLADDEQLSIADDLHSLYLCLHLVEGCADRIFRACELHLGEATVAFRLIALNSHKIVG